MLRLRFSVWITGARGNPAQTDPGTADQPSHSGFPVGPQSLLTAQQLASAVAGVMPGGTPTLNQPILIPFNMAGQLGGQQGLVLTLPTANLTNIQGLVAAAAAGGIMTLPLQNLQATSSLNSQLHQLQHLQQLQQQPGPQQPPSSQHAQPAQPPPQGQQPQPAQPLPPPPAQPQSQQPPTPTQSQSQSQPPPAQQPASSPQKPNQSPGHRLPSPLTPPNPLQIIGTIPLMPNPVPSNQAGGAQGLQVQPITPQLLTNAQGQIIATVIGNQILPVINTQGITLSPLKPGQQLHQPSQTPVGQGAQANLLHLAHSQASMSQSPVRQASSSSSSSSSSSALSVGQLVSSKYLSWLCLLHLFASLLLIRLVSLSLDCVRKRLLLVENFLDCLNPVVCGEKGRNLCFQGDCNLKKYRLLRAVMVYTFPLSKKL
uniref:POU class 6 homeobox 2 n=1 Tax=Ornithorhynchus anatinus TaxID=9258 RepID=A0A6I8P463_ORNAN